MGLCGSQWGIFWWSLHLNVAVFTLHSHLRCSDIAIYTDRGTPFESCVKQKKNIWTKRVSAELSCSPLYTVVTLTFFTSTDPFTHCSTWELVVKFLSVALSSPLHFLSLSFPLSPYHLTSHLWQDAGEQLPGPDLYLSNTLLCLAPSFSIPSWLPLPLPIGALVCALRLFVHVRTETHPDSYLSTLCRIHNVRRPANDIRSLSFSVSLPLSFSPYPWFQSLKIVYKT